MRILYIDNRKYGHNADLHIDFIKFMQQHKYAEIIGYGNHLAGKLRRIIVVKPKRVRAQLDNILKKHKPHVILTYNCNGSSYEAGRDNIALYSWVSDELSRIDLPKVHITTDYLRSGFRQPQADWFSQVGYALAIFRHRESLKYPLEVKKKWLPFSVDADLYRSTSVSDILKKSNKVGFIGAAHNSSKGLYANRIAAIDYLMERDELRYTKVLNKKFARKMLFGRDYVKFLSQNLFGLTCGGTCNYFTAKYLQIPAARSMLVCSDTNGLDMFPEDTYIKYSKDNLDKMYKEVLYFQKHKDEAAERIAALGDYVLRRHSHHNRARQLIRMMHEVI